MSPSTTECAHLATSRVNRLLRPLRNKCLSLSTLSQSATSVSRATYSKQCSNWDPDGIPPLTILPSSSAAAKLKLDRSCADELELSRRIHAVCDAFRNVAHAAYAKPYTERVPSLAAMCALVIGDHMPVVGSDDDLRTANESEGGSVDGEDIVKVVDNIYEAVPSHYRRFSMVSHALSMVLLTCHHHHTLVNVLLDVCLSFGLIYESLRLLDIVLSQAFLPANASHQPPVTHPAHTTYFLDLHATWIAGKQKSASPSDPHNFTTFTFCQAIVETLAQSAHPNNHILWTCKAMSKLVRTVEIRDTDSFILLTGALAKTLLTGVPSKSKDDEHFCRTQRQLSEWLGNLFGVIATWTTPFSESSPTILAFIDILDHCRSILLHCPRTTVTELQADLPDIVTVLATHIYVNAGTPSNKTESLLTILEGSSPAPTTFARLVGHLCRHGPMEVSPERFISQLDKYSVALRSQKLFKLDASLWACALHHFETNVAASQHEGSALVTKYKHQLMDAVDEAERRCFGGGLPDSSPSVSLSTRPKKVSRANRRMPSGHWQWEEMVGSWIRQTPVHKKQKLENRCSVIPQAQLQRASTYNTIRNCQRGGSSRSQSITTSSSAKISRSRTCSRSSSPPFSEFDSFTEESDTGSEYQDDHDKENNLNSINLPRTRKRRATYQLPQKKRQSNFSSLIADAQMNRVVLHPETGWKLSSAMPASQQRALRSKHPPRAGVRYPSSPPQATSASLLPSDDSLDLFACRTSSPARC